MRELWEGGRAGAAAARCGLGGLAVHSASVSYLFQGLEIFARFFPMLGRSGVGGFQSLEKVRRRCTPMAADFLATAICDICVNPRLSAVRLRPGKFGLAFRFSSGIIRTMLLLFKPGSWAE